MAKKFFTRQEIQEILEKNTLKSKVFYMEREEKSSPDNVILYYRLTRVVVLLLMTQYT